MFVTFYIHLAGDFYIFNIRNLGSTPHTRNDLIEAQVKSNEIILTFRGLLQCEIQIIFGWVAFIGEGGAFIGQVMVLVFVFTSICNDFVGKSSSII